MGKVRRPPNPVTNPLVPHLAHCQLIKLSIASSVESYFFKYCLANSSADSIPGNQLIAVS